MYFLVNNIKDNLQTELLSELYKPESVAKLVAESDDVVEKRKKAGDMLEALKKASNIVHQFQELDF